MDKSAIGSDNEIISGILEKILKIRKIIIFVNDESRIITYNVQRSRYVVHVKKKFFILESIDSVNVVDIT